MRRLTCGWMLAVALALAGPVSVGPTVGAADSLESLLKDFGVGPLSGEPSPVALPDLSGQPATLQSRRGQVVMLYFWATWCPYCATELPSGIETLHRAFGDRGLAILAINLVEPRAQVASWVREHGLTFPVLLDESGAVARAYRVRATPTVVLIDRRGQLVGRAVGARDWDTEGRPLVAALLAVPP